MLLQYTHALMMAYDGADRTREQINNGKFTNQFRPDIIISIRWLGRNNIRICGQKTSILFKQICHYIYIYIYTSSLMHRDGSSVMFPLGSRGGWVRVLQHQTPSPKWPSWHWSYANSHPGSYIYIYIYINIYEKEEKAFVSILFDHIVHCIKSWCARIF